MSKTIRNLEAVNKQKADTIVSLEAELQSRQKLIDSLQSRLETERNRSVALQSTTALAGGASVTLQRSKERETEKRLSELQATVAKDRKQILRLTEVNSQLISRAKDNGELVNECHEESDKLRSHIGMLEGRIDEHKSENEA